MKKGEVTNMSFKWKNRRKILTMMLVLALILIVFVPVKNVRAEEDVFTRGFYNYKLNDKGNAVIVEYTGTESDVTIPESLDGHTVTALGSYLFQSNTTLKKLTMPDSVTGIGAENFDGCTNLLEVKLSDNLESIPYGEFYDCTSLEQITIPDRVTSIGRYAFHGCNSLTEITIPDSVTSIGLYAFFGCSNISSITIPKNVSKIEQGNVFGGCDKLSTITVDSENTHYYTQDNCNVIIEKARNENSNKNIIITAINSPTIPEGVDSLAIGAFDGLTLGDLYIPSSLTFIGCIMDSTIESITVDANNPVYDSRGKKTVIPKDVKIIGGIAFNGRIDIEEIDIPSNVEIIAPQAFEGSGLKTLRTNDGLKKIDTWAFKFCNRLQSIYISSTVESISTDAFEGCDNLSQIVVAEGNKQYSSPNGCNGVVRNDDNTLVIACKGTTIPYGSRDIDISNVYGLKKIVLPETVKYITRINYCNDLSELWIPASVTEIGDYVGWKCPNMTIITPKDSVAQAYAIEHDIPYRNEDIWPIGDNSGNKDNDNKETTSGQPTPSTIDTKTDTTEDTTTEEKKQETVQEKTKNAKDNKTTFNIKNKKTYKKSKKVTIKDKDGIKSVKLNGKKVKVKAGKKSISFKLSKYKKYLKKKNKWNKLVVTDVRKNKKSIQFKVK